MGKLRWYKRDPAAALEGMMVLTLEERGAYNTVLDLIYCRDGMVADDEKFIAGWLRSDVRVWRRIRSRLIELGKLYVKDGFIHNERADVVVLRALSTGLSRQDAGRTGGLKSGDVRRKNNDIAEATGEAKSNRTKNLELRKKEDANGFQESGGRDPDLEIKAQARTLARGLACPSATPGRVAMMVAKGYLTAEQAQKAGFA